jgi:hypothetical protein
MIGFLLSSTVRTLCRGNVLWTLSLLIKVLSFPLMKFTYELTSLKCRQRLSYSTHGTWHVWLVCVKFPDRAEPSNSQNRLWIDALVLLECRVAVWADVSLCGHWARQTRAWSVCGVLRLSHALTAKRQPTETIAVCLCRRFGGVVFSVLASGPKGCGFEPGQGDGFLRAIQIRSTLSSRMGSKAGWSHVVRFYGM